MEYPPQKTEAVRFESDSKPVASTQLSSLKLPGQDSRNMELVAIASKRFLLPLETSKIILDENQNEIIKANPNSIKKTTPVTTEINTYYHYGLRLLSILKESCTSLISAIKSLSPFGFIARFKSDLQTLKHATTEGNYEKNKSNLPSLTKSINGRIFAALVFSDICAYAGAPIGAAVQFASGSWALGLSAGIIAAYAIAVASFQAAYAFASYDMYKQNTLGVTDFIKKLEKDLFPIHKKCFYAAIACNFVAIPLCTGIAKLMNFLPQGNIIPISFVEMVLAVTIFDGLFVKSMSKFNQQHSNNLAKRYLKKDTKDKL